MPGQPPVNQNYRTAFIPGQHEQPSPNLSQIHGAASRANIYDQEQEGERPMTMKGGEMISEEDGLKLHQLLNHQKWQFRKNAYSYIGECF